MRTVRISENTIQRLSAYGKFGESYDDVIAKVLDELEEMKNRESKKQNPLEAILVPALA